MNAKWSSTIAQYRDSVNQHWYSAHLNGGSRSWYRYAFMLVLVTGVSIGSVNVVLGQSKTSECGLYTLVVAANAVGKPIDIENFLDDPFKPGGANDYMHGIQGSSAEQLIRAGNAHGLTMTPVMGWTIQGLRSTSYPVILHVGRRGVSPQTGHWICYLGEKEGKAYLFDYARPNRYITMDYGLLSLRLSGLGIVVSNQPVAKSIWSSLLLTHLGFLAPFFMVVLAALFLRSTRGVQSSVLIQGLVIVGFAGFWVLGETLAGIDLPTNHVKAAKWIRSKHNNLEFPVVKFDQVDHASRGGSATVIDTRTPEAYDQWHIPNSVLISMSTDLDEFTAITSKWDRRQPLILYCATHGCRWSTIIGRRLWMYGFRNIYVYDDGAIDYIEKARQRQKQEDRVDQGISQFANEN